MGDLGESLSKVGDKLVGKTDLDKTLVPHTPVQDSRDDKTLTPEDGDIKDCLYLLKRACQVNYVRFDQIENFIFGEEYRPEVRI